MIFHYHYFGQLAISGLTLISGVVYAQTADIHIGQNLNHDKTAQNFRSCPTHFYGGQAPTLTGKKGTQLAKNTHELCFDGFAVLHSGISRTPIYSAEHLTKARIRQAKNLVREDSFHAESRLPKGSRAELSDYSRSGYDRGHLSPNGDMANRSQQFDSFSLANIAPQNGTHNRGVWRHIESATRSLATRYGEVYVITGVLFLGKNVASIGTGVLVPSHFFKVVYIPSIDKAGVYYSINAENDQTQIISVAEFHAKTGINPLPQLSQNAKAVAFELPMTGDDGRQQTPATASGVTEDTPSGWAFIIAELLKLLISILK